MFSDTRKRNVLLPSKSNNIMFSDTRKQKDNVFGHLEGNYFAF